MLALVKWGSDRPIFLVWIAHQLATSAEATYQACQMARKRISLDPEGNAPTFDEWLGFYEKEHDANVRDVVERLPAKEKGSLSLVLEYQIALQEFSHIPHSKRPRMFKEFKKQQYRDVLQKEIKRQVVWYKRYVKELEREAAGEDQIPAKAKALLTTPELQFYYQVAMPCLMEYGMQIKDLFGLAAGGDKKRLIDLLRLDPYALYHPVIARVHFTLLHQSSGRQKRFLWNSLYEHHQCKLKRKNVKYILGACIHEIFEMYYDALDTALSHYPATKRIKQFREHHGKRLNYSDIKTLFDAVAIDFFKKRRDYDIPLNQLAYAQGFRRNKKLLPAFIKPNSNQLTTS